MKFNILFIDTTHPLLPEMLEQAGFTCYQFSGFKPEDWLRIIHGFNGVILRSGLIIDRRFIDAASNLRFIARFGSGMENIDEEYARQKGIVCLNAPEGNRDAVGEHTVGLLLALLNNIVRAHRQVTGGQWLREENRGTEIMGKTVAIIGYGNMGSAFARRLCGFSARVIAYDKYKFGYSDDYVEEVDMDTVFTEADILSLHVPLTDETRYLVDADYIDRFSKPIYLINTSRGKVVKTSDLVQKLKSGKILGAALDVLEYEKHTLESLETTPADFRYLAGSDKVVLTPHVAGWSHESPVKMANVLARKILDLYNIK